MNLIDDTELVNLNAAVTNFPGLDLGDKQKGIAYQVTAEKSSQKVDDTLEKVIRYKHYLLFPVIKIFSLTGKQSSYSLSVNTAPHFVFDPKTDIVDFDDLLKAIQHLPPAKIQLIVELLEAELPYTIGQLKGETRKEAARQTTLINVAESLAQTKMTHYQHSVIRFRLLGPQFSVPKLYQALDKFYEGQKRTNLPLFNSAFLRAQSAQQMDFHSRPNHGNVNNYYSEGALRINANQVIIENAAYTTEQLLLTTLNVEALTILTFLIFAKQLYGKQSFQVEMDFDLASNGKLSYIRQNSYLHVGNYFTTPVLNPSPLSFSRIIHNISNETINGIFTDIIHGFATEGQPGYFFTPFLELNETMQDGTTKWFKNYFAPTLSL